MLFQQCGVVLKAGIAAGIFYQEQAGLLNGVMAKTQLPGAIQRFHTEGCFAPLLAFVEQRKQTFRRAANGRRKGDKFVELRFGKRIQNPKLVQCCQPERLVAWWDLLKLHSFFLRDARPSASIRWTRVSRLSSYRQQIGKLERFLSTAYR